MAPGVDAVQVGGERIRHAPHRSELRGRAAEPTDGRWQRGEIVRGLYLADEPATAVAEWYRWLAECGLPPAYAIPHDHDVWELDRELPDLRSVARPATLGVDLPAPVRAPAAESSPQSARPELGSQVTCRAIIGPGSSRARRTGQAPQQCLYLRPLPQGHGSLRPTKATEDDLHTLHRALSGLGAPPTVRWPSLVLRSQV